MVDILKPIDLLIGHRIVGSLLASLSLSLPLLSFTLCTLKVKYSGCFNGACVCPHSHASGINVAHTKIVVKNYKCQYIYARFAYYAHHFSSYWITHTANDAGTGRPMIAPYLGNAFASPGGYSKRPSSKRARARIHTRPIYAYRSQNTFVVTLKFNGIHGEISLVPVPIYAYTRFAYLINELIMNVSAVPQIRNMYIVCVCVCVCFFRGHKYAYALNAILLPYPLCAFFPFVS